MFITAPTVAPEAYDRLVSTFADVITNGGGVVTNTNKWGRRTLAYEIQKFREGMYTIFEFDGPNDLVKELERRYKLNDSVLKYLTVKTERKKKLENKGSAKRKAKQENKAKRKAAKSGSDYRHNREDS
jgi:small subunit ribosomal protein S6